MRLTLKGKYVTLSEAIHFVTEDYLSTPLAERLEKLSELVKGSDPELAESISSIKSEFERSSWGTATCKDGEWKLTMIIGKEQPNVNVVKKKGKSITMPTIMFYVDAHIEHNLIRATRAFLDELMIEALIGADQTPERYQEHMRRAAGLKMKLSADTEAFLARLHRRRYTDARKKWLNIHAGGSKSKLDTYQGALASHYERVHPIWKQAKKIYRNHGGGARGREAVKQEFQTWSPFIEGTLGAKNPNPKHIGLPDKLIAKLDLYRKYDSSPEYLAHEHAAFLCNFKAGEYSVRQIKAAIRRYKRSVGINYYNHILKGQPMPFSGRSK